MTWRVLVPSAQDALMVGVNQVIMLSLNMVIIASMIGAGGLGFDVLAALRRLDFGAGLEAGLGHRRAGHRARPAEPGLRAHDPSATARRRRLGIGAIPTCWQRSPSVLIAGVAGLVVPAVQTYPGRLAALDRQRSGRDVVEWINVNFFDTLEAIKNALLLNLLIPFKRFLLGLPWVGVVGLAGAGRLAAGRPAAGVFWSATLGLLIAATGQWEKAMITVYLCGISVVIAMLIGMPDRHRRGGARDALALGAGGHRHAADPAVLRLPDAGRDAVPGRRLHRHDRRRRLCRRAGDPLHRAWPARRRSAR